MSASTVRTFSADADVMRRALEIARGGIGSVEPNPAVGAVVVDTDRRFIAEGFHQQFGYAHAEVNAIASSGHRSRGAQLFVTLEPCSHQGKTPPCADAVIAAGFRRVVVGCADPAPHTAGQGIAKLRAAGIEVVVGVCQAEAQSLIAPFRKLISTGLPWVHAKWAMTLDGRIATPTGHSKWISSAESRAEVHHLRGRMDAIITGAGTVRADDPLLTARPSGTRTPLRVVVDSDGSSVQPDGQLMSTLEQAPVAICVRQPHISSDSLQKLADCGAEIIATSGEEPATQVRELLVELGRRQYTNVLLEAGSGLLGSFFDEALVDEVHVYISPKIIGGRDSLSPVGGMGLATIPDFDTLEDVTVKRFGNDTLIEGRCRRSE